MMRLTSRAFAHVERGRSHALTSKDGKNRLLAGVAASALRSMPMAVALGVALPVAAGAGPVTVNPVQSTTYNLNSGANPITFGPNTLINAIGGDAVDGDAATGWT